MDDDRELKIEALLDAAEDTLPRPRLRLERSWNIRKACGHQEFLVSTGSTRGHARSLDTANGAASTSARQIFADLGAQLTVIVKPCLKYQ